MEMVWVWLELLELGPTLRSPQMQIYRLGATLEIPSILWEPRYREVIPYIPLTPSP